MADVGVSERSWEWGSTHTSRQIPLEKYRNAKRVFIGGAALWVPMGTQRDVGGTAAHKSRTDSRMGLPGLLCHWVELKVVSPEQPWAQKSPHHSNAAPDPVTG